MSKFVFLVFFWILSFFLKKNCQTSCKNDKGLKKNSGGIFPAPRSAVHGAGKLRLFFLAAVLEHF